jgi:zinc protease
LDNGIRALVLENDSSPSVVITGVLHGGSLYEPPEQAGLAGFSAGMLDRGTTERGFSELAEELEAIGADIGFSSGRHTIGFDAKCLAEDATHVMGRMAEMLVHPSFDVEQVERLRGQILTAIQQRDVSTRLRSSQGFRELAYGPDHPYGRDSGGTKETITAIARDDLASFFFDVVRPAGGIVTVVGALPAEAAVAALNQTLGAWQPEGDPPPRPVVTEPEHHVRQRTAHIEIPGKVQSDIVLGNAAIERRHSDWLAASLANAVLGVFGLMGRLGTHVRDQKGLAYYAYSRLTGGLGPGPWFAAAGVNPAQVEAAIEAILLEMGRMRTDPVPDGELDDVKAFVTGSMPLQLETNAGVARALADIALYDLDLDYLQRFPDLIAAIKPVDVLRAAQAHLHPDSAAIAVAGPPRA